MSILDDLTPHLVWKYFEQITQVPRPSKNEGKIIKYLEDFAKSHSLEYKKDKIGNIVILKPSSEAYADKPSVVIQSHMDMVCEKNSDVNFDFLTDPIKLSLEIEGWVSAQGTTLGADCGIGMAAALAVLACNNIELPAIEALFTVDEETGLSGALGLGEDMLESKYLINVDSEDEGEIFIGCAGGIDTIATLDFLPEASEKGLSFFRIDISGLCGGHSGDDIEKGRANSNKILAELLHDACRYELVLSHIDGGNLRNAIPRESYAICGIPVKYKELFLLDFEKLSTDIINDFRCTEPNFKISINEMPPIETIIPSKVTKNLLRAILGVPNGVIAMSFAMPGLVKTSSNLASIKIVNNKIIISSSQRSSNETSKYCTATSIESVFSLAGFEVAHSEGYPGWSPNPDSKLVRIAESSYEKIFGIKPRLRAIHAGLECGLFLEKYPKLDMVSFGPTIRDVHSPSERLNIASVEKFWKLLITTLQSVG
ncbi:MAG: aminoacyl-histidine dipeptidase [Rikenellaceae bacterium]